MSNNYEKQLSTSRKIGFGTIYEAEFKISIPHRRLSEISSENFLPGFTYRLYGIVYDLQTSSFFVHSVFHTF